MTIELRGQCLTQVPLAEYTSWRVGGPAERFYIPADTTDLVAFLQQLPPDEPITWLGLGSNVLVRDGGIAGTVIVMQGVCKDIQLVTAPPSLSRYVRAEAGAACATVARFCARNGFQGGEFLAGVPGTIGGALAMNAGAFGGETWQYVVAVETVDREGCLYVRYPKDYQIGYREVSCLANPAPEWFIAGHFEFQSGDKDEGFARIKALLAKRSESQPTGMPSGGSVFRNPPGDYAARLIEDCGLKGLRIGDACVSEKHANFIINEGRAAAEHIEQLIAKIQACVLARHGVTLVPEVRILGKK